MSAPRSEKQSCCSVEIDYRALFEAVPGLYLILDPNLNIIAVNDAYAKATIIERTAVVGRHLFEVFPDNPDDPAADGVRNLRASLERVLASGKPDIMAVQKYDIRLPDGSFVERHWSPMNKPLMGADGKIALIIHQAEDITALIRLQTEKAEQEEVASQQERQLGEMRTLNDMLATTLRENHKLQAYRVYLADVVASSNDAIVTRTVKGRIASWNSAAELMFGYNEKEVIGQPASMLAPRGVDQEAFDFAKKLERGETVSQFETVRRRRDGSEFPVSISASLVRNAAGQVIGTSAIIRELTERQQAQERLNLMQAELIHLSRWNTMGMMASTIAHELNQPLSAVVNYVRAATRTLKAQDHPAAAQILDLLDKAVEETKLAGNIIRSLREFIDKRGAGRRVENINALVDEAISLSLVGPMRGKVTPIYEMDPLLPPVLVDKVQIQQVLLNLIRNAIEAMDGQPNSQLKISTGQDDPGFIGVSVADTGPGLAPEIAARLFQPFMTTKDKGMGIGLTICQSIIEAHGGNITAQPVSPKGVCFRFRLPVATEEIGG